MQFNMSNILLLGLLALLPNGTVAQLNISPSIGVFSAVPIFTGESESVLGLHESTRIIESPVFGVLLDRRISQSISIVSRFHYSRIFMKAHIWAFNAYDGLRANNYQLNVGANINFQKLNIGTHFFTQWTTQIKAINRETGACNFAGPSNSFGFGPSFSLSYPFGNFGVRCFYNLPLKSRFTNPGLENAIYLDDSFGIEGFYRFEIGKK